MIVTIKTDQPAAEVGLFTVDGDQLEYRTWHAHRELSATLLTVIKDILAVQHQTYADITGVVVFKGPGSFTGLRIGIAAANALAYGLGVPIVGAADDNWVAKGVQTLVEGQNDRLVLPHYGAEAHITVARK